MKVFLLYPDHDCDPEPILPLNTAVMTQDLELKTLFEAMAKGDEFLLKMVEQIMFSSLHEIETIKYRQAILKDCLEYPDVIEMLYAIPLEFLKRKRKQWLWISSRHSSAGSILSSARHMLEASLDLLKQLRHIAETYSEVFESKGFRRFFAMIQEELDDDYLATIEEHIKILRFPSGTLLGVQLGKGNEGVNYILCKPDSAGRNWFQRVFASKPLSYSFSLHPRDNRGAQVLGELRNRGIARVANAVAQAAQHCESFFNMLRLELAFYVGCLNVHEQLNRLGEPVAFPQPISADNRQFVCTGLYDISLALTIKKKVIGNDIDADLRDPVIITGPNQGGKTTFLRSVGQAQLMMQCGMFVPAESFSGNLCTGLFTHFRREEDKSMESGKFEEELKRMSLIIEYVTPHSLILFNESFAATNECEGSEIAWQIVSALFEKQIKVFYVTHLYVFARRLYEKGTKSAIFLRAERLPDKKRTFKMRENEPLETSYGVDLYNKIFKTQD